MDIGSLGRSSRNADIGRWAIGEAGGELAEK